jgi:hypothetical protein
MAEKDSTTKRGREWPTTNEINKVTDNLSAIRAIGDLLCTAMDSVGQNRSELHENTLVAIGLHLEDLATEGLVILRYEEPRPQAAAQGGAA